MTSASSAVQLYLERAVEPADLVKVLRSVLGLKIETLEVPDPDAEAFLMLTHYPRGFRTGVTLSWKRDRSPKVLGRELVGRLAAHYHTRVATDLPARHPSASDPYWWSVAEPDGTLVEMAQDTSKPEQEDSLVLDPKSRKVIQRANQASA